MRRDGITRRLFRRELPIEIPRWKEKERENRDETIHPPERAIITSNSVLSGFDPGIIQPGQRTSEAGVLVTLENTALT